MTKICTDIEQSKKLLKLGIDRNTADMYWWSSGKRYYIEAMDDDDFNEEEGHIPCWSLSALLGLMPSKMKDGFLTLFKETNESGDEYCCCYDDCNGNSFHHFFGDTAIDACYNMVVWLL